MFLKSLGLALIGLSFLAFSARAGTPALEGVVKDPSGRPIKGADVRIEAKNLSKVVKTDASGHYISDALAVGTYKVTLLVNGSVKASILNAKTEPGRPTQLNFDLKQSMGPAKRHMVWVPGETGTLIGSGGRWVEVDEKSNPVDTASVNNVQRISGSALQNIVVPSHPAGH
jgi:Carboxypeptidase regulatory-like domain